MNLVNMSRAKQNIKKQKVKTIDWTKTMDKKEQKHKENKSQVLKHGKPQKFQASVTVLCARTALFACLILLSRAYVLSGFFLIN